jgi:hypothetical protein
LLWITRRLLEDDGVLARGAGLRNAAALVGLLTSSVPARTDVLSGPAGTIAVRTPAVAAMEAGPLWVSVATWDPAGEHVVIADPGSGAIYVYDTSGKILRRVQNPGRGALEFTKPNYAFLVGNRYFIATSPYRWLWFDQNLRATAAWELDWDKGQYSRGDTSEFDFSATHLYAIGATMDFAGKWSDKGVIAVSLKDRTVQQLVRFAKDTDELSFYNTPPFNLAVCGGKPWLLRMAPTVSIMEARDGGKQLRSFPAEFQRRASVPLLVDASSLQGRYAAVRNTAVADGLFCTDDRLLLLLGHKPRPQGGLQWLVYPIDPAQDVMARPIELPTTAGDIVFVPGRKKWAILEKGPMKYTGVQPLTRLISFPRPELTSTKARTAP